ncbi:lasso peptide biosynthesis B2 protein [Candidatus Finniella inopinata]|nr:lasso peptide biosynthesis B2 protein [Candidatus Finniella inopinata]
MNSFLVQFEWAPGVYGALCNDRFVILKASDDEYLSMSVESSVFLSKILREVFVKNGLEYSSEFNSCDGLYISQHIILFIKNGLIVEAACRQRNNRVASPKIAGGIKVREWVSDIKIEHKVKKTLVIKSFYLLLKVHRVIKRDKIKGILSLLQTVESKIPRFSYSKSEELSAAVEAASFFYPKKTMCLAFAATLALLHKKQGLNCDFVIGVQNLPFYAHAWVQVQGKVVNDREELNIKLAPILFLSV